MPTTRRNLTADLPTIRLTPEEFRALPEYSTSFPTGVIVGKRWRADLNARERRMGTPAAWIVREYAPSPKGDDFATIVSFRPIVTVRADMEYARFWPPMD